MSALIQATNDREDARLSAVEGRAESEGWSPNRFASACKAARIPRLAPRTQYKHQSYVSQVFKTVIAASEQGKNPVKGAIWTRKERDKRIREDGIRRVALGRESRGAALFARPIFAEGPIADDEPLFWPPSSGATRAFAWRKPVSSSPTTSARRTGSLFCRSALGRARRSSRTPRSERCQSTPSSSA